MARAKNGGNGRVDRLEESMAALAHSLANLQQTQSNLQQAQSTLVLAQAALAQQHTVFLARMAEIDARMAETDRINSERFARIETILLEHSRILRALPDAIREKIVLKFPRRLPRSDGLPPCASARQRIPTFLESRLAHVAEFNRLPCVSVPRTPAARTCPT
jgi:hypothetical protein